MPRVVPRADAEFNEWQAVVYAKASASAAAWSLDAGWMGGALAPAHSAWSERWLAYQNPATRTPLITFEKQEARRRYEPLLRTLVGNLRHNTRVSDDERREMGLATAHGGRRAPLPAPTSYPDFTVDTSLLRHLTVRFRDHEAGRRAKPRGAQGAVVRYALLDAPPASVDALSGMALNSASPYTLEFTEAQRGQMAYFCLAWHNARGEKGPWSEIQGAIVP